MKYTFLIILLCLSVLLMAADPVAVCMKVKGKVTVLRAGKSANLAQGDMLYHNDELTSGDEAYAAVKFVDGSALLKLFPNSNLRIQATVENGELNKRPYVQQGDVYSRVMRRAGVYEVETPTTVASVKGTDFLVSVDADGYTELFTMSGVVNFRNKHDGKHNDVGAGKHASSAGEGDIEVGEFKNSDLDEDTRKLIEEEGMNRELRVELQNPQGEKHNIIIEFK